MTGPGRCRAEGVRDVTASFRVMTIARREWRDALAARWFWFYAAAVTALCGGMFWLAAALIPGGLSGFVIGGRVLLTTVNLFGLLVPLMGLTAGVQSIARERDRRTLGYLLAQPVARTEVLLGKWLGTAGALGVAVAAATAVMVFAAWWLYLPLPFSVLLLTGVLAWLLALATLSIGLIVGAKASGLAAGQGALLGVWLLLVVLADLGVMGAVLLRKLSLSSLVFLSVINPVHQFRIAAVAAFRPALDVLGPAGAYLYDRLDTGVIPVLVTVLLMWTVAALLIAVEAFRSSRAI